MLNNEKGRWLSLRCMEMGTVLFEVKDGAYWPHEEDELPNQLPFVDNV